MSQVRSVVRNGRIDETSFLQAHKLARIVFEPEIPEDQFSNVPPTDPRLDIDAWKEKLSMPDANILYFETAVKSVRQSTGELDGRVEVKHQNDMFTTSNSALNVQSVDAESSSQTLVGFFFCFPRSRDDFESYHIWIAAVHPSARGLGIFPALLEAAKDRARQAQRNFLTVATFPERFGRMYAILNRKDSDWEIVKWEEVGESKARKVIMKSSVV